MIVPKSKRETYVKILLVDARLIGESNNLSEKSAERGID